MGSAGKLRLKPEVVAAITYRNSGKPEIKRQRNKKSEGGNAADE
jgi:hypothetical protein